MWFHSIWNVSKRNLTWNNIEICKQAWLHSNNCIAVWLQWQAVRLTIEIVVYKNLLFICGIENSIMLYAYVLLITAQCVFVCWTYCNHREIYMNFEIITPYNGYMMMRWTQITRMHRKLWQFMWKHVCMHIKTKVKFTQLKPQNNAPCMQTSIMLLLFDEDPSRTDFNFVCKWVKCIDFG